MKGFYLFLSFSTLFVAFSCERGKQAADELITVDVTKNYPQKELILQDFLDVEYIPLETTDEFITSANILSVGKETMFFKNLNWGNNDIFIFNRNGKAVKIISRRGQGGEEYSFVLGVVLDEENNELFVNDHILSKVFVYDLDGNYKRSFKQREDFFYNQMGEFDQDNLICFDGYFDLEKDEIKRNYFLLVSKKDGSIREIPIPYEKKIKTITYQLAANGKIIKDRAMRNRELIRFQDSWVLTEPSADTIYRYSNDHALTPFIVRTPSIQTMESEVFLFAGVLTDRYYFLQTVKKEYDYVADNGFPRTDLIYDRQENAIFECAVYNVDFTTKKPMSLVYEIPMFSIVNNDEIAFMKRLEAHELVEAYQKGQLKGKLKEIAATLDEEANPVIMVAKYKK